MQGQDGHHRDAQGKHTRKRWASDSIRMPPKSLEWIFLWQPRFPSSWMGRKREEGGGVGKVTKVAMPLRIDVWWSIEWTFNEPTSPSQLRRRKEGQSGKSPTIRGAQSAVVEVVGHLCDWLVMETLSRSSSLYVVIILLTPDDDDDVNDDSIWPLEYVVPWIERPRCVSLLFDA